MFLVTKKLKNFQLVFPISLLLLIVAEKSILGSCEVDLNIHDENCEFLSHISSDDRVEIETQSLLATDQSMHSYYLNSIWGDFSNKKYDNFHKPCLVAKQMRLKGSNEKMRLKRSSNLKKLPTFGRNLIKRHVDWASSMRKPQDQKLCGSCWAFATTSQMSAQLFMESSMNFKTPPDLSEQFLVDCDPQNFGCNGGMMDRALEFMDSTGYVYAKDYPYIANQSNCSAKKHHIRKLKRNVEIVNYFKSNEEQLMLMLQNGPVSLGIAAGASLYHYNSGILLHCGMDANIESLNHAVVLVGYGFDELTNVPYWKIMNSWGVDWGEDGFFRVLRDGKCRCGICLEPSQIVINHPKNKPHHPDVIDNQNWNDAFVNSDDHANEIPSRDEDSYGSSSSKHSKNMALFKRILNIIKWLKPL